MSTSKTKLDPIRPGEILLEEFLKPFGLTMSQLALRIKVPSGRITDIVHGKRDISGDTAIRLGLYFNTGPEFWLNLQSSYTLRQELIKWETTGTHIEPHVQLAA